MTYEDAFKSLRAWRKIIVAYLKAISRNLIGQTTRLLRRSRHELATYEMKV
jgi:hypothetical protein